MVITPQQRSALRARSLGVSAVSMSSDILKALLDEIDELKLQLAESHHRVHRLEADHGVHLIREAEARAEHAESLLRILQVEKRRDEK